MWNQEMEDSGTGEGTDPYTQMQGRKTCKQTSCRKISWNLATEFNFMFRLLTWALKLASFLTDFSVLCRSNFCIFRDTLNTLKYLHFNGYTVLTKGSVKKLPTSLLLLYQMLLLPLPPIRLSAHIPASQLFYHVTKSLIHNAYSTAKVEAPSWSQGVITTATKSDIHSQTKIWKLSVA